MGVFKKLRDVLFDVEEDDLPLITKTEIKPKEKLEAKPKEPKYQEENTIKEIKMPKDEVSEKPLNKTENTFNFPIEVDEKPKRISRSFAFDEAPKKSRDLFDYSRGVKEEVAPKQSFKPTPIISPVYGILDQNYSKDDIIIKTDIGVKGPDLDEVRKKAYGLDNKKDNKKKKAEKDGELGEDALKTLDEILMAEEKVPEVELSKIEEPPEVDPVQEEPEVINEKADDCAVDDTIETDLFNLIDSMYENKEESEEE